MEEKKEYSRRRKMKHRAFVIHFTRSTMIIIGIMISVSYSWGKEGSLTMFQNEPNVVFQKIIELILCPILIGLILVLATDTKQ